MEKSKKSPFQLSTGPPKVDNNLAHFIWPTIAAKLSDPNVFVAKANNAVETDIVTRFKTVVSDALAHGGKPTSLAGQIMKDLIDYGWVEALSDLNPNSTSRSKVKRVKVGPTPPVQKAL